jgi:hypothetical protein
MQAEKEKSKKKPQRFKLLHFLHLLWMLPLCFFLFMFSLVALLAWENIYGAGVEFINRYPNSELIWSGTHSGPTGDYGTQETILWTADDASLVEAQYQNLSEEWFIKILPVQELDFASIDICNWFGFWEYDYRTNMSHNEGCDTVKANLPSYGTVIIFSYTIWVG